MMVSINLNFGPSCVITTLLYYSVQNFALDVLRIITTDGSFDSTQVDLDVGSPTTTETTVWCRQCQATPPHPLVYFIVAGTGTGIIRYRSWFTLAAELYYGVALTTPTAVAEDVYGNRGRQSVTSRRWQGASWTSIKRISDGERSVTQLH